jgi:hypothetical protein
MTAPKMLRPVPLQPPENRTQARRLDRRHHFDSVATADLYPNRPSIPTTEGRLQGQRAIAAEDGTSPSVSRVWID